MAKNPDGGPVRRTEGGGREPRTAQDWVALIREQEMPAFGATVAAVQRVSDDDQASAARLAQVILQDAALTTKVLKLANSVYYNPMRQSISTISRAIVVLGFNLVVEIAIGVMLVDALLVGGVRKRVVGEMARCFHAAVQARALLQLRKERGGEEVFIAALLARVGEMAFWCFGGPVAQRLDAQLTGGAQDAEAAQQAVLGFHLRQLSLGLAREWRLGSLLIDVLEGRSRPAVDEQAVLLAHRLAATVEKGWESPAMHPLLEQLAGFTGESVERVQEVLATGAGEATRIANFYGAPEAGRLIPVPTEVLVADAAGDEESGPDPLLQLRILREIAGRIAAGASLNEVLELVLEGLYRAVGFERVIFALLTPNRQQLVGKRSLGPGADALVRRFIFTLGEGDSDLFDALVRVPRALSLGPDSAAGGLDCGRLELVAGVCHGCIAPVLAQGRPIGLIYADRPHAREAIDRERFESFLLFGQQVTLAASRSGGRQE